MDKQVFLLATVGVAALWLPACTQAPSTKGDVDSVPKEAAKPAEAVTAQRAYYEMYKPARSWAPDLLALSMASGEMPGMKNEAGKAWRWTATFVSPGRKEARKFTYAVVDSPEEDIHKGVSISDALPGGGATPKSKPFSNSEFVADSDAVHKVAAQNADAWLKKHPNQTATFQLGNASRFSAPVWYVMWGTKKNGYAALVNATTGTIIK